MSKKRNIILRGRSRVYRTAFLFAVSIVMTGLYAHIYVSVLGLDLPKTAILKKKNAEWCSKIEVLDRHLDECDATLSALQMRDDDIYRSIFGMNEIPAEVRTPVSAESTDMPIMMRPTGTACSRGPQSGLTCSQRSHMCRASLLMRLRNFPAVQVRWPFAYLPSLPWTLLQANAGYQAASATGLTLSAAGLPGIRAWISPLNQAIPYMPQVTAWWRR